MRVSVAQCFSRHVCSSTIATPSPRHIRNRIRHRRGPRKPFRACHARSPRNISAVCVCAHFFFIPGKNKTNIIIREGRLVNNVVFHSAT